MKISIFIQLILFILCAVDEVNLYRRKFRSAHSDVRKQKLQGKNIKSAISIGFRPQQIHISFGKNPTDIVVLWATNNKEPQMTVQYSSNTKITDMFTVNGQQIELQTSNDQGTRYWHRAYLPDLKPGMEYYYRISSKNSGANSELFHFIVPVEKFNSFHSYMVLADMGTQTKKLKFIVHEALHGIYTSVFHIGDISYNLHERGGMIGDKFLSNIQPMAAKVPYMVSPGDHEAKHDFKHYRYRFSMPNSSWPMKTEKMFYSFNIGAAHFISLNTEIFFSNPKKKDLQLTWLEKDLKTVNKHDKRPWIIIMGHRPLYSSCDNRKDCLKETPLMKKELEDLFFKYGVDLYLSGHYHNYERTWPVYKHKVVGYNYKNPKAPIYITVGTLGSVYLIEKIIRAGGSWSAKRISDGKESYGVLDVINSTHLRWKVFLAANNVMVDSMWIVQKNKNRFGDPKNYLENNGKDTALKLPPEPIIIVGKPVENRYMKFKSRFYGTHTIIFQESVLIVALITVCSFVFFICIFYKKLWRR